VVDRRLPARVVLDATRERDAADGDVVLAIPGRTLGQLRRAVETVVHRVLDVLEVEHRHRTGGGRTGGAGHRPGRARRGLGAGRRVDHAGLVEALVVRTLLQNLGHVVRERGDDAVPN